MIFEKGFQSILDAINELEKRIEKLTKRIDELEKHNNIK